MKGHSFHFLILLTLIQRYQCQFTCKTIPKPKREASPFVQDDPGGDPDDRLGRSPSQHSKQKADLALIIDTSGSISQTTFNKLKENLEKLFQSDAIDIGKDNVRVAIIRFGTKAKKIIGFDKGITRDAVIKAIGNFQKLERQWTNIVDGLKLATKEFKKTKDRPNVQKVAFLISDGKENCRPDTVRNAPPCAKNYYKDCNFYIAANCSRPHGGMCKASSYRTSAVFGEFAQLKKAGGGKGADVTLAIIGVGNNESLEIGRARLKCWATEKLYVELPSYDKLKETIENLLRTLVPKNPGENCKCYYVDNETCSIDDGKCGRYLYINITKSASGNGRPCPKYDREWTSCLDKKCGLSEPKGPNGNEGERVQPKAQSKKASGVAWWVIFVALAGALALILVIAIIIMALIRRQRVRRAVTAGVQPSVMESLTERVKTARTEMASQQSAAAVNENVQPSVMGVSKSVQPSTELLQSKQEETVPAKVDSGVGIAGTAALVDTAAWKSARELSKGVQPGESLMMPVSKWQSPQMAGHKVSSRTSLGDPTATAWKVPPKTVLQKTPSGALVVDATAAVWKTPSQAALRKASSGKVAKSAAATAGKTPSKTAFQKSSSSKLVKDSGMK